MVIVKLERLSLFMSSLKFGVFIVNLLFFILGCNLFYASNESLHNLLIKSSSIDTTAIYLCLIISTLIVIISFLGCCGTFYDSPCMLKSYAVLILICIVLEICVFIMVAKINIDQIGNVLKKEFIEKYDNQDQETKDFINALQSNDKCCGIVNYEDYKKPYDKLPESCCDLSKNKVCTQESVYKEGCGSFIELVLLAIKKFLYIILGIILGIQVLIIVASIVLSEKIKDQFRIISM